MSKLTIGNGKLQIECDESDKFRITQYNWYHNGRINRVVIQGVIGGKTVSLGRFILNYSGPLEVDHKDHNEYNFKRDNLRLATRSQQMANSLPQGLRVFKGVFVDRKRKLGNPFRACIKVNRKTIHIGYFKVEEDAAKAYDTAAIKYFGEFALLNFPNKD